MSYTALYRKWRPDNFEDVKGQDHIVTTLKNQMKTDRVGHAYLFCGTRGTGKTTVAKILAKAVNCENPIDGSPCNECKSCKNVQAGVSMNVIEIDAASNNGVDNIREIREEVSYSPTEGRFKVYIIDEVHMLSIGAFNALLKTLEEPPSYVIFILATTEAHKLPITILSRCQRYDFKRISVDTIAERLKELIDSEKVEAEEKAILYIAKAADGALRDAISLLDQCLAFYMGQKLTYDKVLEVLGAVDTEVFSKLLRRIIASDALGSIKQLEELIMAGRDLSQFTTDFTWYMRNLLLVQTSSNDAEDIMDVSAENLMALKEEAQMVDVDTLMRYIRIFSELSGQIRYSSQKRVLIEIALIKLTRPAMEQNLESILNRLGLIEKQLETGVSFAASNVEQNSKIVETVRQEKSKEILQVAVPEDVQKAVNAMSDIVNSLTQPMKNYIKSAKYKAGGENRLLILTSDQIAEGYLKNSDKKEQLEEKISALI
ncbi:MAG: DNA polymerase III subunit gamma/tau, partial [Clostridiales bacterium]|nr:DNA polymerase III subunit gamma/tau [Clostridiales bacterium]